MEKQKHYLTQYCELHIELQNKEITFSNMPEEYKNKLSKLYDKAIKQSGLTAGELAMICACRKNGLIIT